MKKDFIVERSGKSFVLYAGLLDEAHTQGLKAINTTLVQVPNDENGRVAIVQATVETEKGTFSGLGDAAPDNVARPMVTCLIRHGGDTGEGAGLARRRQRRGSGARGTRRG